MQLPDRPAEPARLHWQFFYAIHSAQICRMFGGFRSAAKAQWPRSVKRWRRRCWRLRHSNHLMHDGPVLERAIESSRHLRTAFHPSREKPEYPNARERMRTWGMRAGGMVDRVKLRVPPLSEHIGCRYAVLTAMRSRDRSLLTPFPSHQRSRCTFCMLSCRRDVEKSFLEKCARHCAESTRRQCTALKSKFLSNALSYGDQSGRVAAEQTRRKGGELFSF
jgi:hypothetical protein